MPKSFKILRDVIITAIVLFAAYDATCRDGQFCGLMIDFFVELVSIVQEALNWISNKLAEFIYMPT